MVPQKRICHKLLRTECNAPSLEIKVQKKQQRHEPQAVAVLNSQIQGILRFGATPTEEHESQGARRHRDNQETKTRAQERRRGDPEQQSYLLHGPNFVPSSRIQSFAISFS